MGPDPGGGSKLSLIGAKSVLWRELSGPGRRGWRPRRERIWLEGGAVLLGRSGQRLASDRWLRNFRRPARHRLFHALCAFSCWTAASRCLDASPNAPTISSAVLILGGALTFHVSPLDSHALNRRLIAFEDRSRA